MFNLLKEVTPTYTWPVSAKVATNGGKVTTIKFDAEFNRLSDERLRELVDPKNESRPKNDAAMLDEILVSIKAKDESGEYGTVGDDEAAALCAVAGVATAIVGAFLQSRSGEKAKN